MQQLTIDFIMSLDGFGSATGWPAWWGMESKEYLDWLATSPEKDHPVLLGANTYRMMYGMIGPEPPEGEPMTAMTKYVFSASLDSVEWANSTLVRTDAIEAVRQLKEESDLPMRTIGSLSLCNSLLRAGLVDRLRTVIFPVINGASGGDPIFGHYPDVTLELTDHRTFDGGLQLLTYIPTVVDGPPSVPAGPASSA